MARPRLVVTRRLPKAVEDRAAVLFDTILNPADGIIAPEELPALCLGADALLCAPTDRIDAACIGALPASMKIVATFSVGTDHIDLSAARARGIAVSNTPDVLTEATADIALLLILGAARGAFPAQQALRDGRWSRWGPTEFIGKDLAGAQLGLVGMGRIAQATARRALGFGLRVRYWSRRQVTLPPDLAGLDRIADLDALFAGSDIVSLHIPGTPETADLVDARRIALMPRGSVLVNTARGTIVNDDALIAALSNGHLFAAGLDVFKGEPQLDPRYLSLPNAYLLPHIGSATQATRDAMGLRALANIEAVLSGGRAPDDLAFPGKE